MGLGTDNFNPKPNVGIDATSGGVGNGAAGYGPGFNGTPPSQVPTYSSVTGGNPNNPYAVAHSSMDMNYHPNQNAGGAGPFANQNYSLANAQAQVDAATARANAAAGRAAPQSAATQIAPLVQSAGAQVQPTAQAGATQWNPLASAAASAVGPAAQGQAQLGQVSNAQNSAFAQQQSALAQMLSGYANGTTPSLAAAQAQQQSDANVRQQMALAASARPGNFGLAQRAGAQNIGNINTALAGQQNQAMLAERMAAAGQLGGVLQGARGQDQDISLANANAANQMSALNANLGTGANLANAAQQNQMSQFGAQLGQQNSQFNAGQSNQYSTNQAQANQQNAQFNAGAQNQNNQFGSTLGQQNNQYNASAANSYGLSAAQLAQQNNQFNTGASLQQTGLNDSAYNQAMANSLGVQQLNQNGQLGFGQLQNADYLGNLNSQTAIKVAGMQQPSAFTQAASGAASVLPMLGAIGGGMLGGPVGAAAGSYGMSAAEGALGDVGGALSDWFGSI